MRLVRSAALLVATVALPALAADFEGVLEGRMTGGSMNGTYRAQVGRAGIRSEMDLVLPEKQAKVMGTKSIRRVSLQKWADPDRIYVLDEAEKTYEVMDMKKLRESMKDAPRPKYTVRRLGKDRVAGFACENVAVRHDQGRESELCVTSELGSRSSWARSLVQDESGGGLFKALHDAGVEGFPIRWKIDQGDGQTGIMELVAARRQGVPASTFEIPSGYRKATHAAMPGASPEMQKRMEEAMKRQKEAMEKMSPEQRKRIEEMMKNAGQGR
jgi:hypothetical protein